MRNQQRLRAAQAPQDQKLPQVLRLAQRNPQSTATRQKGGGAVSYQYKGNQTYAQEIAAAQAEAEARKADAAKAREELRALQAAKRKAEEFAAQQRATEEAIFELTNGVKKLPPPIHGGRRGLEAAAAEAHGWWTRKQKAAV
jgi:hypothetical protein